MSQHNVINMATDIYCFEDFLSFAKPEEKKKRESLIKSLEPYSYKYVLYEYIGERTHLFKQLGYWRKANAIHSWFVQNIQNGEDDCRYYIVEKEEVQELLRLSQQVMSHRETASVFLPTLDGFFFGSTEYDEYYFDDISLTIQICQNILEQTDWDTEVVYYHSSW